MPKGIKPKSAIDKVLGDLLENNRFTFNKEMSDVREYDFYTRLVEDKKQSISLSFQWLHSMLIQEANKTLEYYKQYMPGKKLGDNLKHWYTVGFYDGNKGHQLLGFWLTVKYQHILAIEDQKLGVEEIQHVRAIDPVLNTFFFTQEELEEKLTHTREALEHYVIPFLDGKLKVEYRKPRFPESKG
jgi:hypothetical protein